MCQATKHLVRSRKVWERLPPPHGANRCQLARVLALSVHYFSNSILTLGHRPIEVNILMKSCQQHAPQLYLQSLR